MKGDGKSSASAGVNIILEDRPYRLGETINFTVDLSTSREIEVSEGRVHLVCKEEWTEVSKKTGLLSIVDESGPTRAFQARRRSMERELGVGAGLHFRESYVHRSVAFL